MTRGSGDYLGEAFGLRWRSDCPIPSFSPAVDDGGTVDVEIQRTATLEKRPGGRQLNTGEVFDDGTRVRFEGATFDMYCGSRIRWFAPHADEVPLALYSTVAAHVLAWRGFAPLHGSAVAIDGGAVLIVGQSGAGKSTLAHALTQRGGQLVSDDLSVLRPLTPNGMPELLPGRPAIRLIDTAADDNAPKALQYPHRVLADRPVPLVLVLLLQEGAINPDPMSLSNTLMAQQFRPRWMAALPEARQRTQTLFLVSQQVAMVSLPPASMVPDLTPAERAEQVECLLRKVRADGRAAAMCA